MEIGLKIALPLILSDGDQLKAFASGGEFYRPRPIILKLPGLSAEEAFATAERLNQERNACGCSLGAWTMAAAFLLCAALLIWRYGLFTLAALERLPLALIAAVLAMGIGKTIGIAMGRRRARRLIHRLIQTYEKPV